MDELGRINIGAFLGHMDAEYSYEVCMGMEKACRQADANLFIFPGMFAAAFYSSPQRYDYQINTVYRLAQKESIDVLIISLGTIGAYLYTDDYKEFLNLYRDTPIILLEESIPGYSCISIDNDTGLSECLEHLINVHHCRKICYMDGHKNNPDAVLRLQVYHRVLERHGLSHDDNMVYTGYFRQDVGPQIRAMLRDHPDTDAICFANDDMAKGSYPVLKELGKTIGKDILVTGFDDNPAAPFLEPPLTTVRVSSFSIGSRAITEAIRLFHQKKTVAKMIPSQFIVRESCGCSCSLDLHIRFSDPDFSSDSLDYTASFLTNYILEKYLDNRTTSVFQKGMQQLLLLLTNPPGQELIPTLRHCLLFLEQISLPQISLERFTDCVRRVVQQLLETTDSYQHRLALMTMEAEIYAFTAQHTQSMLNRQSSQIKNTTWVLTHIASDALPIVTQREKCFAFLGKKLRQLNLDEAYLLLYRTPVIYWGGEPYQTDEPLELVMQLLPGEPVNTFSNCPVTAAEILNRNRSFSRKRCTRYIFPVFANEEHFGYLICAMDQSLFHFANIATREVGLTIKLMHLMHREEESREQLLEANRELTKRSQLDVLTGIYNRRGFIERGTAAIRENYGSSAIIAYLDLDHLKQINDQFGHENGDFAIAAAAKILKRSCRHQDIIARIGGDEFALLSILSEDTAGPELIEQRIIANMQHTNKTSDKPFYIELSIGIMKFCCQDQSLNTLLKQVDQRLYENKKQRRSNISKSPDQHPADHA